MKAVLLALTLFSHAAPAPKNDVELVERFLKTPTADLPPAAIDAFLRVDAAKLPKKLRKGYEAKRVELHTLKLLAAGKKKGPTRVTDANCATPTDAKSNEAGVLLMAGYEEVEGRDVSCAMERTGCSEQQLMCEFTLNIVIETKNGKKKYRFFFHARDPIMAIVAGCRKGLGGQNAFFSGPKPACI